jgi:hypothetical protein
MQISDKQPINRNFLSQLDFRLVLKRTPHVNFFLQKTNVPQLNLPSTPNAHETPFTRIPQHGDHIVFSPLAVEFKVDEDFQNYQEIQSWLYGLGFPQDFQQHADLRNKPIITGETIKSDISIFVLNSVRRSNFEFIYYDAFPTSLSALEFDVTDNDTEYLGAIVTFDYTYFSINRV